MREHRKTKYSLPWYPLPLPYAFKCSQGKSVNQKYCGDKMRQQESKDKMLFTIVSPPPPLCSYVLTRLNKSKVSLRLFHMTGRLSTLPGSVVYFLCFLLCLHNRTINFTVDLAEMCTCLKQQYFIYRRFITFLSLTFFDTHSLTAKKQLQLTSQKR